MEARATTLVAVGAGCWLLTLVYFAAQPVVAAAWDPPYSVAANTISDLGNTSCGVFDRPDGTSAYVCSPRHTLMNATFVVTGLLTTAGAVLGDGSAGPHSAHRSRCRAGRAGPGRRQPRAARRRGLVAGSGRGRSAAPWHRDRPAATVGGRAFQAPAGRDR